MPSSIPATLVCILCATGGMQTAEAQDFRVLVFSKTAGFRHASIPEGIALIQTLGAANNFAVDASEDAADFEAVNLAIEASNYCRSAPPEAG